MKMPWNERFYFFALLASVTLLMGCLTQGAYANNLNVFVGSNVGADEAGLATAELVFPYLAEMGPFVGWSRDSGTPDNRYNLGMVGRLPSPWLNFFIDVRLGYQWNSAPVEVSDRNGFNFEPGVGYRFVGRTVDIIPRVGFNAVTSNDDVPEVNLSVGFAFVL
jgi:hypothetical protein